MSTLASGNRIQSVDALRGVALFGILIVNMNCYSNSFMFEKDWLLLKQEASDKVLDFIQHSFFELRFVSIFAFLFGLGLTLQMDKFRSLNKSFLPFYLKRLSFLLIAGIIHASLVYYGDILLIYSLMGMLIIPFLYLRWQWSFVTALFVYFGVPLLVEKLHLYQSLGKLQNGFYVFYPDFTHLKNAVLHEGFISYVESHILEFYYSSVLEFMWNKTALSCILFGVAAGKSGLHNSLFNKVSTQKKISLIIVPLTVVMFLVQLKSVEHNLYKTLVNNLYLFLSAISYILVFLLLFNISFLNKVKGFLALCGRSSFSCYLFHSLCYLLIFSGLGWGLYGQTGPFFNFLLALLVFTFQLLLVRWYYSKFKTAPVEKLWRLYVYGKNI